MKLKNLNELTIQQFNYYKELVDEEDMEGILRLFGIDKAFELSYNDYQTYVEQIKLMSLSKKGTKKYYIINGKKYFAELNILKLNAGQFIDMQNYMQNYKLHQLLSIFLLPVYKKNLFGKEQHYKYNDGYDVLEVQEDILNYMKIGEASELSAFFLSSSTSLLAIINNSLMLKMWNKIKKRDKTKKI